VTDDHDYKPYIDAVKQGFLKEGEVDVALTRLFTARMKLGMFDPPEIVPYSKIDENELDSAAHRALARKLADESMVLLKNDGTLPLKTSGIKIAVIGPLASQTRALLGNYTGIPTHTVSILEGLRAEFNGAQITYVPGTQFLSNEGGPVPPELLTTDGKPGIKAEYAIGAFAAKPTPLATRVETGVDLSPSTLPKEAVGKSSLSVRWTATLTLNETGDYKMGMLGRGFTRVFVDDKIVATSRMTNESEAKLGKVHLEQGKTYALRVEFSARDESAPVARLIWSKVDLRPSSEAEAAARAADVVVAVVGITSELEGEEMQVNEVGFKGGDRTSIDLPKPEQDLLEAVAATGKPLVVVLTNGSALGVNWANAHANAILDAWYPGEEGGAAVAETLSGRNNPAGRLPVTFYTDVSQLPPFEDYSMKGRTYRYFEGTPLYPFGYGLSYTKFAYSGLTLPTGSVTAGSPVTAEVTVTNTGDRAGDEIAQLYLSFPAVPGAPLRALRAFQRIHLEAGASQKVRFELSPRDLSMVTESGEPIVAEGRYSLSIGGGQPGTDAQVVTANFNINGKLTLPE
jgi:beta-glucosidase